VTSSTVARTSSTMNPIGIGRPKYFSPRTSSDTRPRTSTISPFFRVIKPSASPADRPSDVPRNAPPYLSRSGPTADMVWNGLVVLRRGGAHLTARRRGIGGPESRGGPRAMRRRWSHLVRARYSYVRHVCARVGRGPTRWDAPLDLGWAASARGDAAGGDRAVAAATRPLVCVHFNIDSSFIIIFLGRKVARPTAALQ
jgi:hypothetical protein